MYTMLQKLTKLSESMDIVESQTMLLVHQNKQSAREVYESASTEMANIVKGLKTAGWSPTADQIIMAAAVELLADDTNREAIVSAAKNGDNALQQILTAAGSNQKANVVLSRLVKQHGPSLPAKIQKEFQAAAADENAKKQLVLKYGKLLDVIGRVQTGTAAKPAAQDNIKDWFK